MARNVTLDQVLDLVKELSPLDKTRLIERVPPEVAEHLAAHFGPHRSLWGLCADLGPAPSA